MNSLTSPSSSEVAVDERFMKADYFALHSPDVVKLSSSQQRAELYALRKQAIEGDCTVPKPGPFELPETVRRWSSWSSFSGQLGTEEAKRRYSVLVSSISPDWEQWKEFSGPATSDEPGAKVDATRLQSKIHEKELELRREEEEVSKHIREKMELRSDISVPELLPSPITEPLLEELRSFWFLLLKGAVVYKYPRSGGLKCIRVLWLDPSGTRLCLEREKRTATSKRGKSHQKLGGGSRAAVSRPPDAEKGLYLRDLSDVRMGAKTSTFLKCASQRPPENKCLSLIGTERSLDLELPSEEARNQMYKRFKLLLKALKHEQLPHQAAAVVPSSLPTASTFVQPSEEHLIEAEVHHFMQLLSRGFEVHKHCRNGETKKRVLWLGSGGSRLHIGKSTRSGDKGIHCHDITEIRRGVNSASLARIADGDELMKKCLSIIGSERTIDIHVSSFDARELLIRKLEMLLQSFKSSPKALPATAVAASTASPAIIGPAGSSAAATSEDSASNKSTPGNSAADSREAAAVVVTSNYSLAGTAAAAGAVTSTPSGAVVSSG